MKANRSFGLRRSTFLLMVVVCGFAQALVAGFEPVDFKLEDRALVLPVDEGVRRIRLSVHRAETDSWETVTIAHVDGRSGHMKLRLPDGLPLDQLRCEISRSDPFPASFYEGATSFSETADNTHNARGLVNAAGPEDGTTTDPSSETAVEESDIWKWRDRTLYFFNTLRGLQVFDLSDLETPRKTASLRMPAVGEQMYLVGDEHVALLANNWNAYYGDGSTQSSEVILIRHEGDDLQVAARFEVDGTFVESRMVGPTLYAVTRVFEQIQQPDESWRYRTGLKVYRFRFDDPASPESVPPLEMMGDETNVFYNAVVTATPDFLFIIPATYNSETRTSHSQVHVIQIHDPASPLAIQSRIELGGRLNDKFKLREQDGLLTTITQVSAAGATDRLTRVETFDLAANSVENPPRLGSVDLAPGETVRGTRFDGDRLYVVTFRQIDPLFMIDLTDPTRPEVLAELEIPGWSTYLEPMGDRLLSIGVEDRRVAVSLFDVSDPGSLSMLERTYLGEEDSTSWSEANYDEKAIGHFAESGLLILPFSSYADGSHQSLMQVIDVGPDDLTRRGVIDSGFNARRSQAFDPSLVAVSGRELLVIDLADRDQPVITRRLSVAWPVDRVEPVGVDHLAQFGSDQGYWWSDKPEPATMRITRTEELDTVVSELPVGNGGQVAGSLSDGNRLCLLTVQPVVIEVPSEGDTTWTHQTTYTTHVIDVTLPEDPVLLGSAGVTLDGYRTRSRLQGAILPGGELVWYPVEPGSGGYYWGYPEIDGIGGRGDIWWPYYGSNDDPVIVTRISDPSQPEVIAHLVLTDNPSGDTIYHQMGSVFFEDETLTYGYQETRWLEDHYASAHYVRQIDLKDPAAPVQGKPVNCPGLLEHVLTTPLGGTLLFTTRQKIVFNETDKRDTWPPDALLEASVFDGLDAYRVGTVEITDGAYTSIVGYGRFLLRPRDALWWNARVEDAGVQVIEWDLLEGRFKELPDIELAVSPLSLNVSGHLLFGFGSMGVDVIAAHQLPDQPDVIHDPAMAAIGMWGSRSVTLSHDLKTAWIAVGDYGVETVDVSALVPDPAPTARAVAAGETDEWIPVDLSQRHLVAAGDEDYVGPIPSGYDWRLQPAPEPVGYPEWVTEHFGPDASIVDPQLDSDFDGWSNAAEFALGTAPNDPASRTDATPYWTVSNGALGYTFTRDPTAGGISVEPEISSDLTTWTPAGSSDGVVVIDDGWIVSVRLTDPVLEDPRRFVRLKFVLEEAQ